MKERFDLSNMTKSQIHKVVIDGIRTFRTDHPDKFPGNSTVSLAKRITGQIISEIRNCNENKSQEAYKECVRQNYIRAESQTQG